MFLYIAQMLCTETKNIIQLINVKSKTTGFFHSFFFCGLNCIIIIHGQAGVWLLLSQDFDLGGRLSEMSS